VDNPETARVLLFSILAVITAIPAGYLFYRAVRTRWHVLIYLSLFLFFFAGTTIVAYVILVPDVIRAFIALDYPVFLAWFVRKAYTRAPSARRRATIFFITIISLKIIHAINIIINGVYAPARIPVSEALLVPYFLQTVVSISMVALSFAWYAVNGYKAYHESLLSHAPAWLIKRNKFVMFSAILYIFAPLSWLLFPFDEAGFSSPLYIIPSIAVLVIVSLFIVLTILGWISPEWFKRLLDKNYAKPAELITAMDVEQQDGQGIERVTEALNSSEIISIIDYIGQHVANLTKRSPSAMKGLLLLAIKTQLHDEALYHARYGEIESVVKTTFKELLARSGVEDPQAIIAKVLDFLVKNKANLMMFIA
jgi:hypothetical protein